MLGLTIAAHSGSLAVIARTVSQGQYVNFMQSKKRTIPRATWNVTTMGFAVRAQRISPTWTSLMCRVLMILPTIKTLSTVFVQLDTSA